MKKNHLFTLTSIALFSSSVQANDFINSAIDYFMPKLTQTREIGDITSPIFMPKQGHVFSRSIYTYSRSSFKHRDSHGKRPVYRKDLLAENITFGVTDRFSIYAERQGGIWTKVSGNHYHTKSKHWIAGLGYSIIATGKDTLQGYAAYYQLKEQHVKMAKTYSLALLYAHQFDWGLPYIYVTRDSTLNKGKENDPFYTFMIGSYQHLTNNLAFDLFLEHDRQISSDHNKKWTINADISYKFTDGIAFVVTPSYTIKETRDNILADPHLKNLDVKQGFGIGATLNLGF